MRRAIEDGILGIPPDEPLPNDSEPMPYTLVADEAFPLRHWLMKPYPHRYLDHDKRIFNYRLCRARRIVENAFGVVANRWRVLAKRIDITPSRAELVVLACCALHNLLISDHPDQVRRSVDREDPTTHVVTNGEWRQCPILTELEALKGNNASNKGKAYRNILKAYFNSIGAVPWQEQRSRHVH